MATIVDGDFAAQLLINGTWTTIKCLQKDGVTISGGRQKDADTSDSLACKLTLRDPGLGHLNSRNPRSPYYGQLGRATQMRAIVPDTTHLYLPSGGALASTPDTAALDIVGDLDVRADVQPLVWDTTLGLGIADKYLTTGNQRSWLLFIDADRKIVLTWSVLGTLASNLTARSDTPITIPGDGRLTVRAALDVNNGSGGWTATFYTGTSGVGGSFTQVGAPVTGAGVTSIFSSSAPVRIAVTGLVTPDPYVGRYHALQIRSGIGGTVVANPDFDAQAMGTTSFADSTGKTWTLSGGAEYRDFDVRAHTELARFPIKASTPNGGIISAPVTGAGVRRRLDRPKTPLGSPLLREATKAANLPKIVAYFPCEDGAEATQIASGIGGPPMRIAGDVTMATGTDFPGTSPLVQLQTGSSMSATIPAYASTGVIAFRALIAVPDPGWPNNATVCAVAQSSGVVRRWALRTDIFGNLKLQAVNIEGDVLADTGPIAFGIIGARQMIGWQVSQQGSDVHWQIFSRRIRADLSIAEVGLDGVFTSLTVRAANAVSIGSDDNLTDAVVGHVMVGSDATLADGLDAAIVGNNGEPAGIRIQRLFAELGVPFRGVGNLNDTEPMGPQKAGKPLDLLGECEASDGGALYEPRDSLTMAYRTRTSMYNQIPAVTLAYGQAGESPTLDPDEPADSDVINDYTASRDGGSSFQAVIEDGPNSIQDPPDGIGRYDAGDTFKLASDAQVEPLAWWRAHLGSWDEASYKRVEIVLSKLAQLGKTSLAAAVARAGVADRIRITTPPEWLAPAPIELLAQGWTETIRNGRRIISHNTSPARPWDVGVADGVQRATGDGSTLAATLGSPTTDSPTPMNANPYLEVDASDWVAASATISRSTAQAHQGVASLRIVAAGGVSGGANAIGLRPVNPARTYRAELWAWSTAAINVGPAVDWYTALGVYISTGFVGPVLLVPSTWTRISGTLVPPGTAAQALMRARHDAATPAATVWHADEIALSLVVTVSIASTPGDGIWTTDPADFPLDIMIDAERVTVSSITGASSPQVGTIAARAVDGWGQAWPSGTPVDVAQPVRAAR